MKKNIIVKLFLIVLLLLCFFTNNNTSFAKPTNENIEYVVKKFMQENKIPGLSVAVIKNRKEIFSQGFGFASKGVEVTPSTFFEIGSNSKAFTAFAVYKLADNNILDLNDDVAKHIKWFDVYYNNQKQKINIKHLLEHKSGIPAETISKIPVSSSDSALEDTIKALKVISLKNIPGDRFEYATINYDILGLIIQKVSSMSYEEYMKTNVFDDLGLNETYAGRNSIPSSLISQGYKLNFLNQAEYDAPTYRGNTPAGYIISNIKDMSRWLKLQLELWKDKNLQGQEYVSGWFIDKKSPKRFIHDGANPNYSSCIMFDTEKNIGVVILCNTNNSMISHLTKEIFSIVSQSEITDKNKEKDINLIVNKLCILIFTICAIFILTMVLFILKLLFEISRKRRCFQAINFKKTFEIFSKLLIIIAVAAGIYLIPNSFFGMPWNFIFIWVPYTLKHTANILIFSSILLSIYVTLSALFAKKNKSMFNNILLGLLSGLGNAIIIFTINSAITSTNDFRLKLLFYFVIGLTIHICSQKTMRINILEYTNLFIYKKQMKIVKYLISCNYEDFEKTEKSRIQMVLNNDTEKLSEFANLIISAVVNFITLICCFVYLSLINIYAMLTALLIAFIIAFIYYLVSRYANKITLESRTVQNAFFSLINDLIGGFKELKFNINREKDFSKDVDDSCKEYKNKKELTASAFARLFIIGEILFTVAIGIIVFIFPFVINNFDNSVLANYIFVLLYMVGPVNEILNAVPHILEFNVSLKRINGLISDLSVKSETCENINCEDDQNNISIKLNEIEYLYKNENFKIGPISYEFNTGEIVFITGGNGSGKSTFAKVITGLYRITSGNIFINEKISTETDLRSLFSAIFVDFHLFKKTYGLEFTETQTSDYLSLLNIDKKVKIKDKIFDTLNLSTGQRKRIALLVSCLENKPFYLFDEVAADQDPEFRKFFYHEFLQKLKEKQKCVIVITHDDQYFHIADKIIKMDLGGLLKIEIKKFNTCCN